MAKVICPSMLDCKSARLRLPHRRVLCRYGALGAATFLGTALYLIIAWSSPTTIQGQLLLQQQQQHQRQASTVTTKMTPNPRFFSEQPDQDGSEHELNRATGLYLEGDISSAYSRNWVGFPLLQHVKCQAALRSPTLNKLYPPKVNRTYLPDIVAHTQNCSYFLEKYGFGRHPRPTPEEEEFPIAVVLLFHKDLDQVLFLLRAIYRPHNAYCLTVDTKASVRFLTATRAAARCLPNVFVASKLEDIVYGGMSRLMADIHCFRDLMQHPVKWRYIINTPGQQFPLRTNLEMVQILKQMAGSNDILGQTGKHLMAERFMVRWKYFVNESTGETDLSRTNTSYIAPPHGLQLVKCSAYGAFSREFVRFVLYSRLAQDLLQWCAHVYSPDELYWGTLNYNTIEPAPGGFLGNPHDNPWISSFTVWEVNPGEKDKCRSVFVRYICIFSPADLPMVASKLSLFANKFYISYQPAALHCLDQRLFNNTVAKTVINKAVYRDIFKRKLAATNTTRLPKRSP